MPPADLPNLLDRHNRIMAAILTRFRNMVLAATEPLPAAAAIPQASLNAMTMNNEVSALVCTSPLTPLLKVLASAIISSPLLLYLLLSIPVFLTHSFPLPSIHATRVPYLPGATLHFHVPYLHSKTPCGRLTSLWAQIKEVQNLLALSREIKKLWIAGPLRKPGDADEKNREKEIDEKAAQVSKLYNILVDLESQTRKSTAQQAPATAGEVEVKKEGGDIHVKHENKGSSS